MKLIEEMLSAIAAHQFQKEKWFHFDFWSKLHSKRVRTVQKRFETVQNTCDASLTAFTKKDLSHIS